MSALEQQAQSTFEEATGYMNTLERSLIRRSKFNNDLLYGIVAMTFEKLLVSLLANNNISALHHTPMALYKEANEVKAMPVHFKDTARLLMEFESICSFDGFGYKSPTDEQLKQLITGLLQVRDFVYEDRQEVLAE
ncbi:MAG: hypothetical protein HC830_05515 [Bacteroidetes bacterium]|nr:hypothetical protein [Bacteroidota bacterium]